MSHSGAGGGGGGAPKESVLARLERQEQQGQGQDIRLVQIPLTRIVFGRDVNETLHIPAIFLSMEKGQAKIQEVILPFRVFYIPNSLWESSSKISFKEQAEREEVILHGLCQFIQHSTNKTGERQSELLTDKEISQLAQTCSALGTKVKDTGLWLQNKRLLVNVALTKNFDLLQFILSQLPKGDRRLEEMINYAFGYVHNTTLYKRERDDERYNWFFTLEGPDRLKTILLLYPKFTENDKIFYKVRINEDVDSFFGLSPRLSAIQQLLDVGVSPLDKLNVLCDSLELYENPPRTIRFLDEFFEETRQIARLLQSRGANWNTPQRLWTLGPRRVKQPGPREVDYEEFLIEPIFVLCSTRYRANYIEHRVSGYLKMYPREQYEQLEDTYATLMPAKNYLLQYCIEQGVDTCITKIFTNDHHFSAMNAFIRKNYTNDFLEFSPLFLCCYSNAPNLVKTLLYTPGRRTMQEILTQKLLVGTTMAEAFNHEEGTPVYNIRAEVFLIALYYNNLYRHAVNDIIKTDILIKAYLDLGIEPNWSSMREEYKKNSAIIKESKEMFRQEREIRARSEGGGGAGGGGASRGGGGGEASSGGGAKRRRPSPSESESQSE